MNGSGKVKVFNWGSLRVWWPSVPRGTQRAAMVGKKSGWPTLRRVCNVFFSAAPA